MQFQRFRKIPSTRVSVPLLINNDGLKISSWEEPAGVSHPLEVLVMILVGAQVGVLVGVVLEVLVEVVVEVVAEVVVEVVVGTVETTISLLSAETTRLEVDGAPGQMWPSISLMSHPIRQT